MSQGIPFLLLILLLMSCGGNTTFTVEEIDGVKHVHNLVDKWADENRISLELVQKIGELEGEDTNYQFFRPSDVALDADGNIYILDSGNQQIKKFNAEGKYLLTFGQKGMGPGELNAPTVMHAGSDGNIYVGDVSNSGIHIFDSGGSFLHSIKDGVRPSKMSLLFSGNIAVFNVTFNTNGVVKNTLINIINGKGEILNQFGNVRDYDDSRMKTQGNTASLTTDAEGNVYLAFLLQNRIEKYSPEGGLLLKIDRKLPYEEKEVFETIPVENASGRTLDLPNYTIFSSGIQVDPQKRIWVNTLSRQFTEAEIARIYKTEEVMFRFEVFDQTGVLLTTIPNNSTSHFNRFRIFGDRIFLVDSSVKMAVYEYRIVE